MKAFQLVAPHKAELRDVDVPEPGPGEILLQITGSGVCHSDLHLLHTDGMPYPMTLGHEPAGRIAALGPGVTGWEIGQHALAYIAWGCGLCRRCADGTDNACERFARRIVPGPGLGHPGAMADYLLVPARFLVPLGDLDPVDSAPLADAALTPYHVVSRALPLLTPSATAVVIGVGGLGHMAVQILRAITGSRIVAVDVDPAKLAAAEGYGADAAVPSDADAAARVLDLTSGVGADLVLDFVGTEPTLRLAASIVGSYGHLSAVGLAGGSIPFTADGSAAGLPWGATLSTPYAGTRRDLHEVVALARQGRIRVRAERHPLSEAQTVLDRLRRGEIQGRAVLVPG
ncbi:NAD(P)-dependent alcohol dehydrogenase [Nonomuraea longicatena]|uniref:alcohol dehydrogenase n=1 Tax=Nonomuraea longicatena TaxID=83682 RepID=A0ABN1P0Y8_9ACTN